jgi:micrococcal nuclease
MLSYVFVIGLALAAPPSGGPGSAVVLDGQPTPVRWSDGDSFTIIEGDVGARLSGYNTLESYGPVHRWGEWTTTDLFAIARAATGMTRKQNWSCTKMPGTGGYGRISVDCPDLREALLRAGLAHAFSVDGPAPAADLATQAEAIAGRRGMWEKGVPDGLVTSLHSADEREDGTAYDRVCTLATGHASKTAHTETYTVCQSVCRAGSCMVYVPYGVRYKDGGPDCPVGSAVPSTPEEAKPE